MAICRCIEQPPKDRTKSYVRWVEPIGYGEGAMICGRKNCLNEGVIWLTKSESEEYEMGIRIFNFDSAVCKVKVK
jgi:hypothetical protein